LRLPEDVNKNICVNKNGEFTISEIHSKRNKNGIFLAESRTLENSEFLNFQFKKAMKRKTRRYSCLRPNSTHMAFKGNVVNFFFNYFDLFSLVFERVLNIHGI